MAAFMSGTVGRFNFDSEHAQSSIQGESAVCWYKKIIRARLSTSLKLNKLDTQLAVVWWCIWKQVCDTLQNLLLFLLFKPVSSCAHYGSCAQHSGTNSCEKCELVAFDVVCKVVRLCGCVRLWGCVECELVAFDVVCKEPQMRWLLPLRQSCKGTL